MRLRLILRLLLAGLLAGSATLAPWPGGGSHTPPLRVGYRAAHADGPNDWPMFRHDLAHTGYNPNETQLRPPLRLKWSYTTGNRVVSSPAVANGVVYVGSQDRKVYALDAATGALKWTYTTDGVVNSSPAVAGGVVYVGSEGGSVYALDAATGARRWRYGISEAVFSSPAVANGVVYVGSRNRKLYALDAATGAGEWSYATQGEVFSSPAVASGVVYVGSDDGVLHALSEGTGRLTWSYSIWAQIQFSSPAVANGVVYVGSRNRKLYSLDAATGALKWTYTTDGVVNSSPAVAGGVVYVSSIDTYDNKVYALDAATGAGKWSYNLGKQETTTMLSSPAVANGAVYVGSEGGSVYALDATTGALKWSYQTGATVGSSPAVANGVLYVGSWDGKVYAFESQPPPVSLSVAAYQATASFPISWTVAATWTGWPAASYDVQYRDAASGDWTDLLTSTASTSTTFNGQYDRTYYFRARSRTATGALGDWSEPVSTTVDLTAPTGSLSINYGATYVSQAGITLQPSASDATSGVAQMQFSNDGSDWSAWQSYATTKSWALAGGDGTKTVYARFKDNAGNVSTAYTATVILDTTPPTGSIVVNGGATYVISSSVTLALSASDATSGVPQMQLSNDGSTWSTWEGYGTARSWTLTTGDGTKAVYGRFRDNAGNVSAVYSDTIILDSTPPNSAVTSLSPYTNTTSVAIEWSGSDALSGLSGYGIQFKDGAAGPWTDWVTNGLATSATFGGQDGHTYYFQSRARDSSGNTEAYPGGNGDTSTMVDLTAPTGSISINGGALYATSISATLNLSASDAASGPGQMSFSNDGTTFSDWEPYAASKAWALTAGDGLKTVYARFRDQAGNASATYSDTITLISAPTSGPILINGGALYTRVPTVTLSLSPPDLPNTSQMQFSDDGLSYASFEPFTTTRPYTLTAGDGLKEVWVRYKALTETVHSDTIILDTAPPTATVGSLAAYQTSASFPVAWSASDATSGPAAYDLQYRDGPTGTWANWIAATAALSSTFSGQDGRTYGFRARAADNAGNQADYPAEAQAQTTVDTTPPTGSLSAPAYVNSTAITLTLAATDTFGVAGMAFSSDGSAWGSWEPYSTTRPYTLASGDGQKTVYGKFRDNAGNYSSPYSATVTLDATPPGQPFPDDGVSGASRNPTPTFSWAPVTDNLSGVTGYSWRVDSGAETYITSSTVTLPTQADGEHTFSVRALDRAGNYGSYGSHLFTIKTAAPAPPDILQPQSPTAADRIIVSGAAPPNSKVKLYVNGAYFGVTNAGAYGIWNLVNVPIVMGENVLKATATVYELADWSYAVELISALSSPMVVMRVPVYYAPPADMASGVLTPSAGGTVTTTNNYMVIVPQGAFTQSVKVVLTPLAPQSAPTVFGIAGTDSYVALSAVTADTGEKVASFQEPVTVTLSYDPAKLTVPESTLAIHYYDEALGRWVALPSLVDTVNHTVSAQVTHFTVFGVLASLPWRTYLPAVSRGYGGGW